MRRLRLAAILLGVASPSLAAGTPCEMAPADRHWFDGATGAWQYMAGERLKLSAHDVPTILVFDERCAYERRSGRLAMTSKPHDGEVRLPNGTNVPAQLTSFASHDDKTGQTYFVMALPSIWKKAGIPISGDVLGLTGVFLHEFSHTRQVEPLEQVFAAANAAHPMGDDINDDSLQERYRADPAYVAVIEKEKELLFRSAGEPDPAKAKALAAEALALMEARQARWFTGEDSYWKSYDDLFLTMEGFGQWVAYAWLADPKGGGLDPQVARDKMRGSRKWWSQEEGLALFLVVDRFVPGWAEKAFAPKPALAIDLLRDVVRGD